MNIKKTRVLHKRYTAEEWHSHNLRQGEIGFKLSDDKSTVLEARVGVKDVSVEGTPIIIGGSWEEAVPLSIGNDIAELNNGSNLKQLQEQLSAMDDKIIAEIEKIKEISFLQTEIFSGTAMGTFQIQYTDSNNNTVKTDILKIPGWEQLEDIVEGKSTGYSFTSKDSNQFKESLLTPNKFKLGDMIYFTEDTDNFSYQVVNILEEPSELYNGYYKLKELHLNIPNLNEYLKTLDAQDQFVSKIDLKEMDCNVGQSGITYIESIQQIDGKINAIAKNFPNISDMIDEKIGEIPQNEATGNSQKIIDYLTSVIDNLQGQINNLKTQINQNACEIATLKSLLNT